MHNSQLYIYLFTNTVEYFLINVLNQQIQQIIYSHHQKKKLPLN